MSSKGGRVINLGGILVLFLTSLRAELSRAVGFNSNSLKKKWKTRMDIYDVESIHRQAILTKQWSSQFCLKRKVQTKLNKQRGQKGECCLLKLKNQLMGSPDGHVLVFSWTSAVSSLLQGLNFEEDWKLLTILMGMNDICDYCKDKVCPHRSLSL